MGDKNIKTLTRLILQNWWSKAARSTRTFPPDWSHLKSRCWSWGKGDDLIKFWGENNKQLCCCLCCVNSIMHLMQCIRVSRSTHAPPNTWSSVFKELPKRTQLYLTWLCSVAHVLSTNMEEAGLVTCTSASHQGASKSSWLQFEESSLPCSISTCVHSNDSTNSAWKCCRDQSVVVNNTTLHSLFTKFAPVNKHVMKYTSYGTWLAVVWLAAHGTRILSQCLVVFCELHRCRAHRIMHSHCEQSGRTGQNNTERGGGPGGDSSRCRRWWQCLRPAGWGRGRRPSCWAGRWSTGILPH